MPGLALFVCMFFIELTGGNTCKRESPEKARIYDCGIRSLYMLCRLEGNPVSMERLEAALPPPSPPGYSMLELKNAANQVGLKLRGVKLDPTNNSIAGTTLAFIKRNNHGHYLLVQPVGHTGRLVQILDPGLAPRVMDKWALYDSQEWTGFALIPITGSAHLFVFFGLAGIVMLFILWMTVHWRRNP